MNTKVTSPTLKGEFTEPQCTGDDVYECSWTIPDHPSQNGVVDERFRESLSQSLEDKEIVVGESKYVVLEVVGAHRTVGAGIACELLLRKLGDARLFDDYLTEVLKTENLDFEGMKQRLQDDGLLRIAHAICGIANEAGELMENLKKHVFYGAPLDLKNILEEFGDIMWFMGPALDVLGSSYERVQEMNILKLRARYSKGKWDKEEAANRDKEAELEAMNRG